MIRISLSDSEKSALEQLRLNRKSNIGERAYYVLLSAQGYLATEIAKQQGRNIITIRLWLNRYKDQGILGLTPKKQSGRPPKKASFIESKLESLLNKSPSDYGYQEAGWQINIIRHWLSQHGCHACENTVAKALKKLGYVFKRFSKTVPKHAPSPSEKATQIAKMIKKINTNSAEDIEILFADESHFSNQPYVNRGWFKKGEKKQSTQ